MRTLLARLAVLLLMFGEGSMFGAKVGDDAPAIKIEEWVKAGPLNLEKLRGTNILVIEFWATWCAPCRDNIPKLTELQRKHRKDGLIVLGITDEESSEVKAFANEFGDRMNYVIARDREQETSALYLDAVRAPGIPYAFVVNRSGKLVWHGHPADGMDLVIAQVIKGTYDLARARKVDEGRRLYDEYYELSAVNLEKKRAEELALRLKELSDADVSYVPGEGPFDAVVVRRVARFEHLLSVYEESQRDGTGPEALEQIGKELMTVAPAGFALGEYQQSLYLNRLFEQYLEASRDGYKQKALGLARKMIKVESRNVLLLNDVAWAMMTDEAVEVRHVTVALELARRAYRLSEAKESYVADTYARALFDNGQIKEAIKIATKALELCRDNEERTRLAATLRRYRGYLEIE